MRKALLGFMLVAAAGAHAADKPCSKAESAAAEKAVDRVVAWPQLLKAWQDYRHCDSGPVAEVFTDALLRLTVEWKNVDALAAAVRADPQYRDFVYAHLKSDAAKDDREAIYSRAKSSCPSGMDAFCGELAELVKPAAATPPPKPAPAPKPDTK
jgi:hypothetical protein